ncbi:hypothetical protein L596_001138 [Steinernema carpocapsae]|uniref:Uncharacterized protein n=1 Tax=Steinernema carpocapsae TaxID=34508 RepID=A0A4V6I7B1_STECR|nr:hypothetical protein L596_001138 [Steinernema carpocapsae]
MRVLAPNISLFLNLSQCYINKREYHDAIRTASEVLKRDATNEKALFRRAKAQMGTWQLDQAEADFTKLLEHYPDSKKLVDTQRVILNKKKKELDEETNNVYKEMMKGFSL